MGNENGQVEDALELPNLEPDEPEAPWLEHCWEELS